MIRWAQLSGSYTESCAAGSMLSGRPASEPEVLDSRFSARVVGLTDEGATLGASLIGSTGGGRASEVRFRDGVTHSLDEYE